MCSFFLDSLHTFRQMVREKVTDRLHDLVAQVPRKDAKALGKGVEAGLEGEQYREPAGAEIVDGEESILAILFCDIKRDAVEVLAFDR